MPKIIDERVVEMKFDNKQFEHNAQNTLKTLDNLKKSLNFNGAVKGLQEFEKVSNGINLSGMESAIQTVQNRFSTLGIIADQIIRRITDSTLNMAKKIGTEFVIKPMQTGFQEYETQINAVQTIMANTGAPIEDVNAALDELNAYADKTIYNFTEMTRNIGTFTAAGVDMGTSVNAIKGIANLAAISGSSSQQASTAMYQLSQALASGTVKLMDWNSVVNAGMGGQVFQNALKETARVYGIAIDEMIEEQGSFRETLQYGWITSDILTETLAKFTGDLSEEQLVSMGYTAEQAHEIYELGVTANDAATKVKTFTQLFSTLAEARQSGWTQSWEIIIGDFEEAKGLLTMISDRFNEAIGDSANARNLVLQQWSDLGGRTLLIESVINVLDTLDGIVLSVKEAFHDIFPEVTAENLFNITARIWEVTEGLKNLFSFAKQDHYSIVDTSIGEMLDKDTFAFLGPVLDTISRIFRGFFAVIDSGVYIIGNFGKIILGLFNLALPIGFGVLDIFATIGDYLVILRDGIKNGSLLASGFAIFESVILALHNSFVQLLSVFMTTEDKVKGVAPNIKAALSNIIAPVVSFTKDFYNSIVEEGYISKAIGFFKNAILAVAMVIPLAISGFASLLSKAKDYIKESQLIEKITAKISSVVKNLVSKIKLGYNAIRDFLKAAKDFIKTNIKISDIGEKIKDFFVPVVKVISGFWKTLVEIFNESKNIDVSSISGIFEKIKAKMAPFKRIFTELYSPIEGLKKIGIAIKNLFEKIKNAIVSGWEAIPDAFKNIASDFVNGVKNFISSAVSVIKELIGKVSFGDAIKLIGLTSALINIVSFTRGLKNTVKGINNIFSNLKETVKETLDNLGSKETKVNIEDTVLKIVAAVGILVIALWGISKIDQNRLDQSVEILAGLAVGMLAFVFVLKKITKSGSKDLDNAATAIFKISGSLAILVFAIGKLSNINADTLNTGLGRLVELLGVLAIFTRLASVPRGSGLSGYFGLAISVVILAQELKDLAGIDDKALMQGLKGMGGILLELALFSRLTKGSNFSGAGRRNPPFIKMALSVAIFAQVFKGLSSMNDDQIVQGLKAMGGILLEIGIFSRLMSGTKFNFKETILMLVSLGGSLFLFTEAINKTANVSGAKMVAFGVGFGVAISALALSLKLLSKIPILQGIQGVANLAIFAAGITGIIGVLGWVTESIPDLKEKLRIGGETLGEIGTGIGKFIQGIFNPSGEKSPKKEAKTIADFGNELSSFMENVQPFINGAKGIGEDALTGAKNLAGMCMSITGAEFLNGIARIITGESSLSAFAKDLIPLGASLKLYSFFVKGIDEEAIKASANAAKVVTEFANNVPEQSIFDKAMGLQSDLKTFAKDLILLGPSLKLYSIAVKGMDTDAVTASANAAKVVTEFANNVPEQSIFDKAMGLQSDLKTFAKDLILLGPSLKLYSIAVKGMDTDAVTASANAAKVVTEFANNVPEQSILDKAFGFKSDLKTFADDLVAFGSSMNTFASYFGDNAPNDIPEAVTTAGGVVDSLKELFSEGEGSKAFSGSISNLTMLLDSLLMQLTIYYPNFYETGSSIMSNITDGMNSVSDLPVTIFTTTLDSCIRTLNSYKDDFYTIGQNYGIGIANGINSEESRTAVINAANQIAGAALTASRKTFDERSPSKKGYQIGAYFTEGIANGMASLANLTNNASQKVSSGAIYSAQTAMNMINSIVEAGDMTPTIRPVLDLSNVANGAGQINSLLGQTKTFMADAINVRSLNQRAMAVQNGINQNGSIGKNGNKDVVDAINTLGSRIDTLNEDIRNLKIVLNSGIVAGELAPEINRRLGISMANAERGI